MSTCHYCGTSRDLRPYGPGHSMICFPCANVEDMAWSAWKAALAQHVAEAVAKETERCADAARKWEDDYVMDDCAPEHVDVAIRARAEKDVP